MSRVSWPVVMLTSLTAAGCLFKDNPQFEKTDTDAATTTAATATTSTTGTPLPATTSGTTTPTTSGGSATGSSGDVSSDPLITSGDLSTTGHTTGELTTTTGDTTTGDTTTGDTTGPEPPKTAELKHYSDIGTCGFTFWCAIGGNVDNPSTAENRAAECFDAPLEPPFEVSRVGFFVYGTKATPSIALDFHAYDLGTNRPVKDPFSTYALEASGQSGYRTFEIDPPVVVNDPRFCISVRSGLKFASQLGVAVDNVKALPGQTFIGMNGPGLCNYGTFTDLTIVEGSSKTQWCIDATIVKDP